jgi:iron complex outermembrane recepter protein
MRMFKLNPLVLAMAACTLPMSVYAQDAQDSGDGTVEEVVVTGSFRDSLQNAMNIKKNQNGFVDAIVASDIAEFPDNNLAESLQRVPGVAIQRSGGEGRGITVRGLGPTFTTVRLNGMETISTTGGTDAVGGNNRGRGFDFNTFSSDLFSSLTVRKTNSAEVQEGSLGATVDLKAAQPFDYDDFVFTASGQLGYNDLSEENDPAASFLISNIFGDGKFGALFSLSASERTVKDEGASTVRWSNATANQFKTVKGQTARTGGTAGWTTRPATLTDFEIVNGWCSDSDNNPATSCVVTDRAYVPRIPRYDSFEHEMERTGASLSLQFRPTDSTEISVDNLWAKFDATRQETFMEASLNPGTNASAGNLTSYTREGVMLTQATMTGERLLSESRFDKMSTDFAQTTISLKQDFTDSFRMKAMIGKTKSDYDNPIQNTVLMGAENQSFSYDMSDYDNPSFTFADTAYDKATWVAREVRQRPQTTLNENEAGNITFEFDATESIKIKAGVDSKDFSMETDQFVYKVGETSNAVALGITNTKLSQVNPDFIVEYDSGLGDGKPWLIANRELIMDTYNLFDPARLKPNYSSTFDVSEKTIGAFIQVDFNFDWIVPVRGDIGVRQFDTDQSSTGYDRVGTAYTVDHNYSDTLPALNLVVEPIEDFLVRFAYSEGISRAGLSQLSPTTDVAVSGTNRTVARGYPYLEPTKATSYDLGFEWYFAEGASIGITAFQKDIESFVQTSRLDTPYTNLMSELGLSVDAVKDACGSSYGATCNENLNWAYSIPFNSPGGELTGYEISYQQPFTFLPGALSNFGFIGSFTSVDSDLDYLNALTKAVTATKPLVNLSDETYSATIYYENDTFTGRVSLVNRSEYLTTPIGRDGSDQEGTNATTNVDASFGYQFNDSLKFTFEALNLTDEVDDQWVEVGEQKMLSYHHNTGIQYNLGVQYKY